MPGRDVFADFPNSLRDCYFLPFGAIPDGEIELITKGNQLIEGHAGQIDVCDDADRQRQQEHQCENELLHSSSSSCFGFFASMDTTSAPATQIATMARNSIIGPTECVSRWRPRVGSCMSNTV